MPDATCEGDGIYYGGRARWGETFTAGHTGPLTKAAVTLRTTAPVSLQVSIHDVELTGEPGSTVLGSATLANVPATDGGPVEFNFGAGVPVTAGQFYALVIQRVGGPDFAPRITYDDVCGGFAFEDESANGNWLAANESTSSDLAMAVFVGTPDSSPPPPSGGGGSSPPPPPPPKPTVKIVSRPTVDGQNTVKIRTTFGGPGKMEGVLYSVRDFFRPLGGSFLQAGKPKRYVLSRKTLKITKAGPVTIKLSPKRAANKAIVGQLKAFLELKFTPTGGTPEILTRSVVLRASS